MAYGLILKIIMYVFLTLGAISFALIISAVADELADGIRRIMARQSKIRCLCKHEYLLDWKWEGCKGIEICRYRCRKCGKNLEIKVVKAEGK